MAALPYVYCTAAAFLPEGKQMEQHDIRKILQSVADGSMAVGDAELLIKIKPFADLGYAKPDFHRGLRQGVPEIIYGQGKTAQQIAGIAKSLLGNGQATVLITRLDQEKAEEIEKTPPLSYHETGREGP